MAKKTEVVLRKIVVHTWNSRYRRQDSDGATFPAELMYDKKEARDHGLSTPKPYVVWFPTTGERCYGVTEKEAIDEASKLASTMATEEETEVIVIRFDYHDPTDGNNGESQLVFQWESQLKVVRTKRTKEGHYKEAQFNDRVRRDDHDQAEYMALLTGEEKEAFLGKLKKFEGREYRSQAGGWHKLKDYEDDRENWRKETELPYSPEIEAFCMEMEKRLAELAKKLDEIVGYKKIDPAKVAIAGAQMLTRMLPAPKEEP